MSRAPVRQPNLTLAAFSGPCLPLAAVGLPLVLHMPAYYAGPLGLPLAAVGVAFTFIRLFDICIDVLLGGAMDATNTRFGRFRVWMAMSAPVLMAGAFLLFMAKPGVSLIWLWVALLVTYFGFSMGSLAQQAWASALSSDYNQRSRIYGWWQSGNILGMILVLLLPPIVQYGFHGDRTDGVRAMGWFVIILLPLTIAFAAWRVGEPKEVSAVVARPAEMLRILKRPVVARLIVADLLLGCAPAITSILFFFYFDQIKHVPNALANLLILAFFVSGLIFAPVWSTLAVKIGKHRALACAALALIAGVLILMATPFTSIAVAIAVMAAAGASYSAPALLLRAMMADAGDELRLDTGADRTGLLYATLTATTKIGTALAGLSFVALSAVGFRQGGGNGPLALLWLQILFVGAPCVLSLAAAALVWRHPLDSRRHGEILAALARQEAPAS